MFTTQDYGIRDRVAMMLLSVLLLASAQTTAVSAEDDIGEAAIEAVYDQTPIDPAVTAPAVTTLSRSAPAVATSPLATVAGPKQAPQAARFWSATSTAVATPAT